MYDVAIVGAGPAGCAAAISLSRLDRDLKICLIADRPASPMAHTLAPGVQRLLEPLGCWDSFVAQRFTPSYSTRAVWGTDHGYDHDFVFGMSGSGWIVDRDDFDAWLRSCLDMRIDVVSRRLLGCRPGWDLDLEHAKVAAKFVIDASGRTATFATRAGAKRIACDTLTAVAATFTGDTQASAMVEAVEDGWWFSVPHRAHLAVAFFADADVVRETNLRDPASFQDRLRKAPSTYGQVRGMLDEPKIWTASSQRLNSTCGDAWLAAGDAASAFDPLSSAGVLKALRSGLLASFATLDWLRGRTASLDRYRNLVTAEFEEYLAMRAYYYGLETRWPQSAFWRRRCDLDLGRGALTFGNTGRSP